MILVRMLADYQENKKGCDSPLTYIPKSYVMTGNNEILVLHS